MADVVKGNEKIILALLWLYILKHDLDGDDGNARCTSSVSELLDYSGGAQDQLLEWVQPRAEAHDDVQNFSQRCVATGRAVQLRGC